MYIFPSLKKKNGYLRKRKNTRNLLLLSTSEKHNTIYLKYFFHWHPYLPDQAHLIFPRASAAPIHFLLFLVFQNQFLQVVQVKLEKSSGPFHTVPVFTSFVILLQEYPVPVGPHKKAEDLPTTGSFNQLLSKTRVIPRDHQY